ncbi:hypothetical protein F5X97DRAFT_324305 [Nemania serpens]|nr:hypothetical protein F5X97DRAFT_324305 [Nemania serpens]
MDRERYNQIREFVVHTIDYSGVSVVIRGKGVERSGNPPSARLTTEDYSKGELRKIWPPFYEQESQFGQCQSATSSDLISYKHLVELPPPRTPSTAAASSSNTGEGEKSELTPIGFVFDYYITLHCNRENPAPYDPELARYMGYKYKEAPLDFPTMAAIVGLLKPPKAVPHDTEPVDAESQEAWRDVEYTNTENYHGANFLNLDEKKRMRTLPAAKFLHGYLLRWEYHRENGDARQMSPDILWCVYRI